jgi:UDP-GlcNAc:undecaprenyl-phosphate/decaprenyl-phosphate GlcNAc-1-phosphate transferase
MDHPGGRKLHRSPIPRAGGIAIALSYVGSYCIFLLVGFQGSHFVWSARPEIWRMLPAAGGIFLIGIIDDLYGLAPWIKFVAGAGAAVLAYLAGLQIAMIAGHAMPHWASLPLTVAWLLLCTNAVNLIDGMDGLAAGLALFASATVALAALMQGNYGLALAVVPLAGALLGFLPYNFSPATIFLGDCGSLFIGFLLGCYGILWSQKSATLMGMTGPLMALAIPLLDSALSIVRRFVNNKPIFAADRGHIHHRLLDLGMTPKKATLALYGCCAAGAICSLTMAYDKLAGAVLILFAIATWTGIHRLGYAEFGAARRMLTDGALRTQLSSRVAIRSFEKQLEAAETADQCWEIIRAASRQFGFDPVTLYFAGRVFEYTTGTCRDQVWTLRMPLSPTDYLEIGREFGQSDRYPIVGPFAESIRRALTPKIAELDRQLFKQGDVYSAGD